MKKLEIAADSEKLEEVIAFVDEVIDSAGCSTKARRQINMAVEEIFLNISSYSYEEKGGMVLIEIENEQDNTSLTLTISDSGTPFDPLSAEEPDIHQPGRERKIGGLGIMMVKKTMDEIQYEYKDGKNILTIKKNLG